MKLTKYAHACIVLEEQGQKLIIDPGSFTPDIGDTSNVVAVVVTHVHQDHLNKDHLKAIVAANPKVQIFTTTEVKDELGLPNVTIASDGQTQTVGPFTLAFSGEMHANIHSSMAPPHNTAVMVNDLFFYPGDSFTKPNKTVDLLAIPANAPWANIADSMDYLAVVKPKRAIPTHDALLSDIGHKIYNSVLGTTAEANGIEFTPLAPGESIEF